MHNSRALSVALGLSLVSALGVGCASQEPAMSSFSSNSDCSSSTACGTVTVRSSNSMEQSVDQPMEQSAPQSDMIAANFDDGMHIYQYYPAEEVYFDVDRGLYFWMDGERWLSGPMLPSSIDLRGADSVQVPLYSASPYRLHDSVTSMFPSWASANE